MFKNRELENMIMDLKQEVAELTRKINSEWTTRDGHVIASNDDEKLMLLNALMVENEEIKEKLSKYDNLLIQKSIDEETKIKVIGLRSKGMSYREIAKETGISKSSVGNILK